MSVQTPKVIVPGSATVPPTYQHQEFPKAVYGETLEDVLIIHSEEERPDGYRDYDDMVEAPKPKRLTKHEKAKAALEAKREAEAAAAEHHAAIVAYLEEHNVDFDKEASTEDLEGLKVQLDKHLAAQEKKGDSK